MKNTNRQIGYHAYDQVSGNDSSEVKHMEEIKHFTTKRSFERFQKTPAEREELRTRMLAYPNKNGKPVPPNN